RDIYTIHSFPTRRSSDLINAICGVNLDGSHWTLTHEDAVSRIEDGICAFYMEGPRGQRYDVTVAMDAHAHRYLKTGDRDQPDQLDRKSTRLNSSHLGISY